MININGILLIGQTSLFAFFLFLGYGPGKILNSILRSVFKKEKPATLHSAPHRKGLLNTGLPAS